MIEDLDLSAIQDERLRKCIVFLLNLVEELKRENSELRVENQRLRDKINRLKGEEGKPKIKGNTPKPPPATPSNYSSERQRHTPKEWAKGKKRGTIRIVPLPGRLLPHRPLRSPYAMPECRHGFPRSPQATAPVR